ncbi:MAG: sulfatase family protein [Actinomycetota bacterium]
MRRSATSDAGMPSRRRRAAWLAVAVAVLVPVSVGADAHDPPRAEAAVGPAPDIVLVITDDQRSRTLAHMPRLDRLITRHGMLFRSAWVPNPSCCPSRASYYTGTYSHTNGVWKNDGPFGGFQAFDDSSTLATWLDDAGYRTGLFGKYLNGYADPRVVPPGWDEWFAFMAGDDRIYYGFDVSENGKRVDFPDTAYSTMVTYERVSRFIRSTPADRPLFAVWTPIAPHRPFEPEDRYADAVIDVPAWRPPNYNERDVRDKPAWVRHSDRLTKEQRMTIDSERIDQYRTLLSVDDGIGEIVRTLRQTDRLSNTLIVFASDNGLMWGEHRLWKKAAPYDGAAHVPMVLRYDPLLRGAGPTSTGTPVVNIDVAPTVMDLVGRLPGSPIDGESLVPLLDGSVSSVRTRFIIEHAEGGTPAYCGARTKRELYVRYTTGEEEYYRRSDDPWGLVNAAGDPENAARIRELRSYTRDRCTPMPPGFSW